MFRKTAYDAIKLQLQKLISHKTFVQSFSNFAVSICCMYLHNNKLFFGGTLGVQLRICDKVDKIFPFYNFSAIKWIHFFVWNRLFFCKNNGFGPKNSHMKPLIHFSKKTQPTLNFFLYHCYMSRLTINT